MIQITHLGRRTNWNHSDWLPVLSSSPIREPAHRSFPKEAEDWDIERIIKDYASASERMKEAGMDGIEIEAYGHFLDSFWSFKICCLVFFFCALRILSSFCLTLSEIEVE